MLGEATSALDLVTKEKIRKTLAREQRARNMMMIIVAHRISTIVSADRIVVMQAGRIVDDGTCQDLMKDHPYFQSNDDLWQEPSRYRLGIPKERSRRGHCVRE